MKKIKIFLKIIMPRELLKMTLVGMQTTVFNGHSLTCLVCHDDDIWMTNWMKNRLVGG